MAAKELVNDMKLNAEIHPDGTTHYTFEPDYTQEKAGRWFPKKEIWKKERPLGEGTYGKVWLERCSSREGPTRLRAVKMITKPTNPAHRVYCDQELEAIAKFSQQKYTGLFVKSFGWFENEESIFIAMEHIELGDLEAHLKGPLPETEARQISFQILQSLQHLHDNEFVHRDLKPRNVFVMSPRPHWWVKIGDFGFSKRHTEGVALQSTVGTLLFLAPEVLKLYPPGLGRKRIRSDYTHTADIWSLGVMTFYMLCHDYPFPDYHSLWSYVQSSNFPSATKLKSVSTGARELIKSLLVVDATIRLSAKEALQSQWLRQDSFDQVSRMASLAISEESMPRESASPLAGNLNATPSDASKGWGDVEKSSAIVDELPFQITRETQIKRACSHSRTSMEQDPLAAQPSTASANLLDLQAMHENGMSLLDLEMFSEAERICRQAWEGRKQALGEKHIKTLASQFNLGIALHAQGKCAEAETAYRHTWTGYKQAFGEHHKQTLAALRGLGDALLNQGKFGEAETAYHQGWTGHKQAFGEYHKGALELLQLLGDALFRQERFIEAETAYRQAWMNYKQAHGKYDGGCRSSLNRLGNALHGQGKYTEAETVHRELWEESKQALGVNHTETLGVLYNLANDLCSQRRQVEAEGAHRYVYERRRAAFGEHHPDTLISLDALRCAESLR